MTAQAGSEEPLRVVLCNTPPADAERIARALVEAKLAACVNILPAVVSIYAWKGEVCRDSESTLLIKTRASLVPEVTAKIRALHPYEVPEVIALIVAPGEGNPDYLAWALAETMRAPS